MKPLHGFFLLALALGAAGMPPEGQPPPSVPELLAGLHAGKAEDRARAAAALLADGRGEAAEAAAKVMAGGEAADARELLLFLADRPDARFAGSLVAAARRKELAEAAEEALGSLGRRDTAAALAALREGLEKATVEERAGWIAALGFVRSEKAIPPLVALLPSRDSEAAMASLRRLTTLPYTEPRDWNFWFDRHRDATLEAIVRDAAQGLKDENAALKAALERETARANDLEKAGLKERLTALRKTKDAAAEKALLEKEFASGQPALRAWAAEEAQQALAPEPLLPSVLRLLGEDGAIAVRVAAAKSAGRIGKEKSIDALRQCLDNDAPALRVAAVDALADAGGASVAADIERMAGATQPRAVREAAIAALKTLKPKGFAAAAAALLPAELSRPAAESVAGALIELLGALRDDAGVDALVSVLRGSRDKAIRFRAVKALGDIGSPRVVAPLVAEMDRPAAEQEKDVVAEAVAALGRAGGDEARARLEKALGEFPDNPKARENAARGLAKAGTLASVDALLKCAKSDPEASVKKEAWEAAKAISQAAAARLDALEALLGKVGDAPADAPWRIEVRSIIVKPGNFPEAAARVKAHLRPLGDDYHALKDWPNALKAYLEAAAAAPDDLSLAARCVSCRLRAGDLEKAREAGEPLVPRIAAGAPGFAELRLAMIEIRCARNEPGRARMLCPDSGTLAVLPVADRDAFAAECARLDALCKGVMAEIEKRFPAVAAKPEEGWKEFVDLLRAAPPDGAVAFLLGKAEGADAAAKAVAAKALEALTGVAIPAEEGEPRKAALEQAKSWPATLAP